MVSSTFIQRFKDIASAPDPDLATAALMIARLEYPRLDASRYLDQLDAMGAAAHKRLRQVLRSASAFQQIETLNAYLFDEQGFEGNEREYDDPRNSFLNDVLERRTGIPVTLALVYIEVARRAGLSLEGVNFPGHFLLRFQSRPAEDELGDDLILDPFHRGIVLSETDCRSLLRKHAGQAAAFDQRLLVRATKTQIMIRMLVNLKRIYVGMRSFPQGHAVTELLLALNPSSMTELRDRGLLAYHLNDFSSALKDLETYLRFTSRGEGDSEKDAAEHQEIWGHVKTLRRRVASLN
jgi:regulator of sirC expression with transglutaminase-like and TPR domain